MISGETESSISRRSKVAFQEWQKLFIDHEPLQVAQMTLECIQKHVRKDHKIE
jgi:hypothetical protein